MNTVLFAAAQHAAHRKDLLKLIREVHPAHPCHFTFLQERDRREYERELRSEEVPHVLNPLVIVMGPASSGKTHLVKQLIKVKQGACKVETFAPRTPSEVERCLINATRLKADACILDGLSFLKGSALPMRATAKTITYRIPGTSWTESVPNQTRIYITCPSGTIIPADLERRSRVIRLALPPAASAA